MADVLLLIVRWLHGIAAVAWVGGAIFYWLVLQPALRSGDVPRVVGRLAGPGFGQVVSLAAGILVLTGGVLAVDRLTQVVATPTYVAVLSLKVAASGWMFAVVLRRRRGPAWRRHLPEESSRTVMGFLGSVQATAIVGPAIFFLSDLLGYLVERALSQ